MNQFCLVGRIANLPVLSVNPLGWNTCLLTLKIQRGFPESDGHFKDDYVDVEVTRGNAEVLAASASVDHWVTVKGRIERIEEKEEESDQANPVLSVPSRNPKKISLDRPDMDRVDQDTEKPNAFRANYIKAVKAEQKRPGYGRYKFVAESIEYIHI
ncbi:single-stranded DNA-binding protein [Ileibacterium valens]|uniref:single-stranded DNA-binding protein n=1 Tax=Ileibacterium valens TaxID=1862668 RepID=UPI002354077C|nr:single-stranded DNA-binding protein [Ileibacterium valens]